jgi:hypothetical protein
VAVDAKLLTLTDKHLDDFETFWKSRLQVSDEEDGHWNWVKKNQFTLFSSDYEKYAIECEQITQGLMMLEVSNYYSKNTRQQKIIYVDFLSTAPWNRISLKNPPDYKGVGLTLLSFAKQRSRELGYGGRVGLHALPKAENFYQTRGMKNFGIDSEKENLVYFEWLQDSEQ